MVALVTEAVVEQEWRHLDMESAEQDDVLVIGATTKGGIGDTIANYYKNWFRVTTPTPDELDVRSWDGIGKYLEQNGPYSHVVYCAGVQYLGRLEDLDSEDVGAIFDVNVVGFIRVLAQLVRRQHTGRVCAISSLAGRVPMTGSIGYCASKAALNHAIRCAARELKGNWQVTAVVPATVADTPLTASVDRQVMDIRHWDRDELLRQEVIRQPFGRRITKNEVADVVYNLMMGPMTLTGSIVDLTGGA